MAESKSPAFRWYAADFLVDEHVSRMELAEVGLYTVLLCRAWIEGSIPGDLSEIARVVKMPHRELKKLWPAVAPCWSDRGDGRLVQPRMERERETQREYRERMQTAGKKGAASRWPGHGSAIESDGLATKSDSQANTADAKPVRAPFSFSLSSSGPTATPPDGARAEMAVSMQWGMAFFEAAIEANALPSAWKIDPGPLGFAYKHSEVLSALVTAYGVDECTIRAQRMIARCGRTDAHRWRSYPTPKALHEYWGMFASDEIEQKPSRGGGKYDAKDISGGTDYAALIAAKTVKAC